MSILPSVLMRDKAFLAVATRLEGIHDPKNRGEEAAKAAAAYVGKPGGGRDAVAALLLSAARGEQFLVKTTAVWADDDRKSELPRQRSRERRQMLIDGAKRFTRRGAGKCIECDDYPLRDTRERVDPQHRGGRRLYCTKHKAREQYWRSTDEHSMRSALEAWTGQHRRRLNRRHGTSLS